MNFSMKDNIIYHTFHLMNLNNNKINNKTINNKTINSNKINNKIYSIYVTNLNKLLQQDLMNKKAT